MPHLFLFSWFSHLSVSWFAFAVSLITLVLRFWDYRTNLVVSQIYVTNSIGNTQKVILMLSNASYHPVSITDLTFKTSDLECFKPKFGNYKVWSDKSYVRYTDILPVTLERNESKLLIFEIDNDHKCVFSKIKVSTVKKTYTLTVANQSSISLDRLVTIR